MTLNKRQSCFFLINIKVTFHYELTFEIKYWYQSISFFSKINKMKGCFLEDFFYTFYPQSKNKLGEHHNLGKKQNKLKRWNKSKTFFKSQVGSRYGMDHQEVMCLWTFYFVLGICYGLKIPFNVLWESQDHFNDRAVSFILNKTLLRFENKEKWLDINLYVSLLGEKKKKKKK